MRGLRSRILGVCLVLGLSTVAAGAAPAATDIALNVGADQTNTRPTLIPSGGTATVTSKNFYVFLDLSLISAVPGNARARVELGGGLQWGSDSPDPSEKCTSTATTGECDSGDLQPISGGNASAWFWDVVAPGSGTYTFRGEIVQSADVDPDTSNNSSQITIVVNDQSGGGSGGGGGGSGQSTEAKASAVKVSPARPKAGSTVVASVRVTKAGSPVRPSGITCAASVGGTKMKGGARAASGVASCLFKTPKRAKGQTLAGRLSFRAGGTSFTKRFGVKLG